LSHTRAASYQLPAARIEKASEAGSRTRKLEAGSWKLEAGSWKLEAGSWKLEANYWKLETDYGAFSES
jgi:hypothetical protein